MYMDIKDKIEKIGGLEQAVPEKEISIGPEKKVEEEKIPKPEWEKFSPEAEKKKPMVATVVAPITVKTPKSEKRGYIVLKSDGSAFPINTGSIVTPSQWEELESKLLAFSKC